jgi:hypothetical protein
MGTISTGQNLQCRAPDTPRQPGKDTHEDRSKCPIDHEPWYGPAQQGHQHHGQQRREYSSQKHIQPQPQAPQEYHTPLQLLCSTLQVVVLSHAPGPPLWSRAPLRGAGPSIRVLERL